MEEQESYLLITRYLANQTTTEENETLADWIALSKANEQVFEDIKGIWLASKMVDNGAAHRALSRLHDKMKSEEPKVKFKTATQKKWYATAATFIGLVITGGLLAWYNFFSVTSPATIRLVTKTGEKKVVCLEDGTRVNLAPQSAIEYPVKFDNNKRMVTLEGEAYFEVSKNPHRPFVVHTKMLNVTVLGTHFNINSYKIHVSTVVSLLEGRVKVTLTGDDPDEYMLKPGQQLTFNHLNHQVFQRAFDTTTVTGWIVNRLVFKNDKLADAADKINQMYGVKIVFADQATADARLYGTFNNESLISVMETIKATGNIAYKIDSNKVYLTLKQ